MWGACAMLRVEVCEAATDAEEIQDLTEREILALAISSEEETGGFTGNLRMR